MGTNTGPDEVPAGSPARSSLRLLAAGLVCGAAIPLYGFLHRPVGYGMLVVGVALAWAVDRYLCRHLALVATSLVFISTMSLTRGQASQSRSSTVGACDEGRTSK